MKSALEKHGEPAEVAEEEPSLQGSWAAQLPPDPKGHRPRKGSRPAGWLLAASAGRGPAPQSALQSEKRVR